MTTLCPSCHTPAPEIADAPLQVGGAWQCTRCGQQWDVVRLATAASYALYAAKRPIPGAREPNTLTQRQPGSAGFPLHAVALPTGGGAMDADTLAARQREGGGAPDQRRASS